MNCINDLPYPTIQVEKPNLDYAYLLLQDYAGNISEVTAILRYSYQKFLNINEEFTKTIRTIAMVEMRHLDILGQLICMLGLKPEYKTLQSDTNNMIPWNSDSVNYDTDLEDLLKYNIQSENDAIINYKKHYDMIDDIYIRQNIARIIEDEKTHIKCFKELLEKYKNNSNC